jgi:hypothetical protein
MGVKMSKYAYLIIESTVPTVKVGDLVVDGEVKEQDHIWEVLNIKKKLITAEYYRGLRLFECPEENDERKKLMDLIYGAMKNVVKEKEAEASKVD